MLAGNRILELNGFQILTVVAYAYSDTVPFVIVVNRLCPLGREKWPSAESYPD